MIKSLFVILTLPCLAQDNTIDVCEAVRRSWELSGKEVEITAFLIGPSHHFVLRDTVSEKPCPKRTGLFFQLPPSILLNFSRQPDEETWRILALAEKRVASGDFQPLHVTVKGVLDRKFFSVVFHRRDGSYVGNAFGHNGQFPVRFFVRTVRLVK